MQGKRVPREEVGGGDHLPSILAVKVFQRSPFWCNFTTFIFSWQPQTFFKRYLTKFEEGGKGSAQKKTKVSFFFVKIAQNVIFGLFFLSNLLAESL